VTKKKNAVTKTTRSELRAKKAMGKS